MSLQMSLLTCVNEGRLPEVALISPTGAVVGKRAVVSEVQPRLFAFELRVEAESIVAGVVLLDEERYLLVHWFSVARCVRPVDSMNCVLPLGITERTAKLFNKLAANITKTAIPTPEPEVLQVVPELPEGVRRVLDL